MISLLLSSVSASAILVRTGTVIVKAIGRYTLLKADPDTTIVKTIARYALLRADPDTTIVKTIARYTLLRAP